MSMSKNVYWGDLHRHSEFSGDGHGKVEDHMKKAFDEKLDFLVITDHAILVEDPLERAFFDVNIKNHRDRSIQDLNPKGASSLKSSLEKGDLQELHRLSEERWKEIKKKVDAFNQKGTFITLPAYEWASAKWGDRNICYEGDGKLITPSSLSELFEQLSDYKALIIPHHPGYSRGRRGCFWKVHDQKHERLIEIYSQHGSSEKVNSNPSPLHNIGMGTNVGNSVQDALNLGLKVGFVGGSDGHRVEDRYVLTGVFAEKLSRKSIFEALWERRCFATTGERITIKFSINGFGMGSIISLDTHPSIKGNVKGTGKIERIEVVKNGEVLQEIKGESEELDFRYEDKERPERPDNYYYLRVIQRDGEMAWSSPIWVSFLPEYKPVRAYLYWTPEQEVRFDVQLKKGKVILSCKNYSSKKLSEIRFSVNDKAKKDSSIKKFKTVLPFDKKEACFKARNLDRKEFLLSYRNEEDNKRTIVRTYPTEDFSCSGKL